MRKASERRLGRGVTLIELVVTIAVLAIIVAMAVPSFRDLAERRALQGAAEGIVGAIAAAKEEAIKRDEFVFVQFSNLGGSVCVGASTGAACDCATANSCGLVAFPGDGKALKTVSTKTAPAFAGSGSGFTIDPKTGTLRDPTNVGGLELETPLGYAMKIRVNAVARAKTCSSGTKSMAGVKTCTP